MNKASKLIILESKYRFLLSTLCAFFILGLSIMKNPIENPAEWMIRYHIDKINHMIAYAVLAFLIMRDRIAVFYVLILCFFFGLGIEFLQGQYFESRHFEILDLFANISGSILGIGLYKLIKRTE